MSPNKPKHAPQLEREPKRGRQTDESLADFVDKLTGSHTQRITEALGEGFVRLKLDEAERRQALQDIRCTEDAVIEMLRNARDAGASVIFLATHKTADERTIVMLDDGAGIPAAFHETVFEPRVTTKLDSASMDEWGIHGRGMALFSIAANAQVACVKKSAKGEGTSFYILTDTHSLSEVKDQSTMPLLARDEQGEDVIGQGPHNIYKTAARFALSEKNHVKVFVGSDAEILATIRKYFRKRKKAVFAQNPSAENLKSRFGIFSDLLAASDGEELVAAAGALGLSVSLRTAHRILAGDIVGVPELLGRLSRTRKTTEGPNVSGAHSAAKRSSNRSFFDVLQAKRRIKISDEDKSALIDVFTKEMKALNERYYLEFAGEAGAPRLTFKNGKLRIECTLEPSDEL